MERVSVEIWQQILLKVMETNDWPIFATSCTPYTFLAFMYLHVYYQRSRKPYQDYLTQRRRLRLVCRAWNEFVLFTRHRWLPLEQRSPMYKLDSTTTARTNGGVGPVEKLSTVINPNELGTPILSWVSHILKRPASQTPLRTYSLHIRSGEAGVQSAQRPRRNNDDPGLRMLDHELDHEYDATCALNLHDILRTRLHLALAHLSHFHGSAHALPSRCRCDTTTDTNAGTSRSIICALSVGGTAGVDGDMGHTSTAACLTGAFQYAANGHA